MHACSLQDGELTKEQVQRLERVQNYGMRISLSKPPTTNSEEMRRDLKWRTLESRRNMRRLGLMYRCVHRQTTRLLSSRFEEKKGTCTRGALRLFLRRANTEFYRRSFSFRGGEDTIFTWNHLSPNVAMQFMTLVIVTYSNCKVCMLSTTVDFYCKFVYVCRLYRTPRKTGQRANGIFPV